MHDGGGFEHLFPACACDRIEIEMQVVGTVHVVTAGVPRVQVDAPQINPPKDRREIANYRKIDNVSRGVLDRASLDPFRARRWRALHKEKFPGYAVGIPFHYHCAIDEVRQQYRGYVC